MPLPSKCPLCHVNEKKQSIVSNHVFGDLEKKRAFYRCENCDIVYQFPPLSKQEEDKFYKEEFEKYMDSRSGDEGGWLGFESHIKANEETVQRRLKYLLPNLKNVKTSLELGCSSGFMMYPLMEKGISCTGIEPSGFFSDFLKTKNIVVYDKIEDLISENPEKRFDLIHHYFVLEHIQDPLKFLKTQLSLLSPGGSIVFEIPNVADPIYTIFDIPEFEKFYWSKAHPWYFSNESLRFLLDQLDCSYEIIFDQRYDLSNHLTWARDGKPGGMGKFTDKLGIELENFYKKTLISNGYCDTLIGIIKKNNS